MTNAKEKLVKRLLDGNDDIYTELGIEFILTCAAYGVDIQDALELIAADGKMRELQQEFGNGTDNT